MTSMDRLVNYHFRSYRLEKPQVLKLIGLPAKELPNAPIPAIRVLPA